MFSLCDLHFLLCSHEPNILRAQRIVGFSYCNYPQINRVGKSDHMDVQPVHAASEGVWISKHSVFIRYLNIYMGP